MTLSVDLMLRAAEKITLVRSACGRRLMWSASHRAIDAATGPQSPSTPRVSTKNGYRRSSMSGASLI